jgi:uncharacterized protein DUF1905/bacteriocin resistance YdeI/OmpD-like protein
LSTDDVFAFVATIVAGRGGGAGIAVPFSVQEAFGTKGQVKVAATFDGCDYRGSLAPMGGGVHFLGLRKDIRAAIGKDVGDEVSVTLIRDTAPRVVDVPPELLSALAKNPAANERFEALSYTHRKEFAQWVSDAKKQETKDRRVLKACEMLVEGTTR